MRNSLLLILLALVILAILFFWLYNTNQNMQFKTSKTISELVIQHYCEESRLRGELQYKVKVLEDAEGNIGGYAAAMEIPDATVTYLDADGNTLAIVNAFNAAGRDEAVRIATELRRQFPIEESLICP